jgi:uncharacterized Fe-S center protein
MPSQTPSVVYFGSPRQAKLKANETLPAKLDLILERLTLRERVKDETVAIKIHSGGNIGYSVLHPVFVRKVVQAIKDGGGRPFVCDVNWDVRDAQSRGYTAETLGCPIIATAGPFDHDYYEIKHPFMDIETWQLAGTIHDATFLVNFAHAKGHPACGYGGAIKNLALGCMTGHTRQAMHGVQHMHPYFFPEKCPDLETRQKIVDACPFGALFLNEKDHDNIKMHPEWCNACGRCLKVAPAGSMEIRPDTFHVFQEACANSVDIVLSTFKPGNVVHLVLATQITPLCDCFGFTSMPILPDAGVFGSDDLVAIDQAVLDATLNLRLIEENVPLALEVHHRQGHPFEWLHGPFKDPYLAPMYAEKLGVGNRAYELVDVFPLVAIQR